MASASADIRGAKTKVPGIINSVDGEEVVIDSDYRYDLIKETFKEVNTMASFCSRMDNVELKVLKYGDIIQNLVKDIQVLKTEVHQLKKQNSEQEVEKRRMKQENDEEMKRQTEIIEKLKTENIMLKKRLDNKDSEVMEQKENLEKLQQEHNGWKKVQKDSETDLKKNHRRPTT